MTLVLVLSEEEIAVMAEMRRAGMFSSDVDVLKAALFMYGMHFGIPMSSQCWAIGGAQRSLFDAPASEECLA